MFRSTIIKLGHIWTHTEVSDQAPLRNDRLWRQRLVDREAIPACTLPPQLCDPSSSDLEEAARRVLVRFAAQEANKRRDVLFLQMQGR